MAHSPLSGRRAMSRRGSIGAEPVYAFGQAIGGESVADEAMYATASGDVGMVHAAVNPSFSNQGYAVEDESLYATASSEEERARVQYEQDGYTTGDRKMSMSNYQLAAATVAAPNQMMVADRHVSESTSNAELVFDMGLSAEPRASAIENRSASYTEAQELAREQASAAALLATRQSIKRSSLPDALERSATDESLEVERFRAKTGTLQSLAALEDDPEYQEFAAMFENGEVGSPDSPGGPRRGSATLSVAEEDAM